MRSADSASVKLSDRWDGSVNVFESVQSPGRAPSRFSVLNALPGFECFRESTFFCMYFSALALYFTSNSLSSDLYLALLPRFVYSRCLRL